MATIVAKNAFFAKSKKSRAIFYCSESCIASRVDFPVISMSHILLTELQDLGEISFKKV